MEEGKEVEEEGLDDEERRLREGVNENGRREGGGKRREWSTSRQENGGL